jgi:cell wall assembly regulator SMI1
MGATILQRRVKPNTRVCIDLAPAEGGVAGQIIEYVVDSDARPLTAERFAELMSLLLERAETGEIAFDNDGDGDNDGDNDGDASEDD